MAVSAPAHPVVYLLPDATTVESDLIHEWAGNGAQASEAEIVARDALDGRLRQGDDPLVTPVRVAWLPPERDGVRRGSVVDLLRARQPAAARARGARRAIVRREPDRCRVVVGEPARAERAARAVRRRDRRRADDGGFAAFVARQGRLALDRAERATDRRSLQGAAAGRRGDRGVRRASRGMRAASSPTSSTSRAARSRRRGRGGARRDGRQPEPPGDRRRGTSSAGWMSRAYTLDVDDDATSTRLRELGQQHALVFLPSHRSYLDPLVLRHVLAAARLPAQPRARRHQPRLLADRPDRPARRASIFIRRSFSDDAGLQGASLREYLGLPGAQALQPRVVHRGRPHRARASCARRATGCSRYLVDALQGERADATSTSCRYRSSTTSCTRSARWRPRSAARAKTPEGIGWLVGLRAGAEPPVGRVHVRFGEPLSLRAALARRRTARRRRSRSRSATGSTGVTPVTRDRARDARAAGRARTAR